MATTARVPDCDSDRAKTTVAIYCVVDTEPGLTQAQIARRLHIPRCTVHRALPRMEKHGLLLYEENFKLYPFKKGEKYD